MGNDVTSRNVPIDIVGDIFDNSLIGGSVNHSKPNLSKEEAMSVYKFIELVGTSEKSWEDAVKEVVNTASKTLKDLRVAEVMEMDAKIEGNEVVMYRVKVKLSFKYHKS